jgi:hypothetical protein
MAPNWFASLVLILWPLVAIALYRMRSVDQATLWIILAGQLLLPVGTSFKFEMIPQLDKSSIPSLCAFVGCMVATGRPVKLWQKVGGVEALAFIYLFSPVVTSLLNSDPIYIGRSVIPGVGLYDGLSAALSQFIYLIPFLLGRQLLRSPINLQQLFSVLLMAGLAYSPLLIFEIRMSPQLHFWLYGYYPSDFIQEVREGGGFRPMVFMGHGLIAAFFAMTTAVASAVLSRAKISISSAVRPVWLTTYLSVVLVLCKSGAALVYGLTLIPLVQWARPRLQANVAVVLLLLALLYPVMRLAEVFPTNLLVSMATSINEGRAGSLNFRFDQEEQLLEHASQRLLFGWGRFGRNRVFVEDWQGIAADASVTDGRWIITLGQFGLLGFLAEFGLLGLSVFCAAKVLKFAETFQQAVFLAGLALLIAVNIIELLPNSTLSPWTWLLSGALLGSSETLAVRARKQRRAGSAAALLPEPHGRNGSQNGKGLRDASDLFFH